MRAEPGDEKIETAPVGSIPWTAEPAQVHGRRWSLAAARRYCLNLVREHQQDHPQLLTLLNREQRQALSAIYAFARIADDFADEVEFAGQRERLLDAWRAKLLGCREGHPTHPVMIALREAMHAFDLPLEPFLSLLDALRFDCAGVRFGTWEELLAYCAGAACPLGRLALKVLRIEGEDFQRWSDRICTALRLTNHWQHLSVDLRRDRIYLPREDFSRFGVSEQDLLAGRESVALEALIQLEVERTRELYRAGFLLIVRAGLPQAVLFASVWLAGRSVLRMVGKAGVEILRRKPALNVLSFTRTLVGAGIERLPRMVS